MRPPIALFALVALLAAPAASARAGTYTVLSCRDRTGAPAPLSDAAGGWVGGSTGGPGLDAQDRCGEPGRGFLATVSGVWPHPIGSMAWWRFAAPSGTEIEGADVLYTGYARPFDGRTQGVVQLRTAGGGVPASDEGTGALPARWVRVRGLHDPWLQATAQCDGPAGNGDCRAGAVHATVEVLRTEVLLADDAPPSAGPASGSAVASPTWQGTETFAFAAADAGAGVFEAILEVDGAQVLARTVDARGGRCADTTAGGRVFTEPRPCPAAADALLAFDAGALPAGDHDVALRVADAAGNVRTVYAARKAIVGAGSGTGVGSGTAETGAGAASTVAERRATGDAPRVRLEARWARSGRTALVTRYGARSVIRGRLTDAAGTGVPGARIELVTTVTGRSIGLDKGGARTRADGRFTLVVGRGASSRTLALRYRRHTTEAVAAEARLRLTVRAGVALGAAVDGRSIRVAGRLVGRPLPRTRTLVELQARRPGRGWATVRIVRAVPGGRFAARLALRGGARAPAWLTRARGDRFELRARVPAAPGYPYATGASRPIRVR